MNHFPIFMDMQGRRALVVGGTKAAAQKANLLLRAGARVLVVDPRPKWKMPALIDNPLIEFVQRDIREQDLDDVHLVIAASANETQNLIVSNRAQARGLPVNVVDRPDLCSFIMPAIVDRSPMIVAISSGGASPILARLIRAKIEALLPQTLGALAGLAQAFRTQVSRRLAPFHRRRFWEDALESDVVQSVCSKDIDGAADLLLQHISENACQAEHLCETHCRYPERCHGQRLGEVWLVGAGPGDPDLLTIKAHRLMQRCDVVLHDRLVPAALLDRIRRDADIIDVGKAPGGVGWPQDRINKVMIDRARAGDRVLRLKCGDPMIFGRGGEELDALRQAGVRCSIVPGITAGSAVASESGVALTDRRSARHCLFTNGRALAETSIPNLEALRAIGATLIVYMAYPWLSEIRDRLLQAGFPAKTAILIASSASRPDFQEKVSCLERLSKTAFAQKSPSLLVVGDAIGDARHRTELRLSFGGTGASIDPMKALR